MKTGLTLLLLILGLPLLPAADPDPTNAVKVAANGAGEKPTGGHEARNATTRETAKLRVRDVLILLTLTGAFGGLAASLVRNEGRLLWPQFTKEERGAADANAGGTTAPGTSTNLNAYHLGFISDVMVGVVASNSIQLALAAVLDYKTTDDNLVQKVMSLVALGLVAGFSGPKILAGLAKKLEGEVERNLRETDARQQKELEKQQVDLNKQQRDISVAITSVKEMAQANVYKAMSDAVRSDVPPPPERAQVEIAAKLVEREPEAKWGHDELMILAYKALQEEDYTLARANAEKALAASPPRELLWRIHNLLGYCYHWSQPKAWTPGGPMDWYEKAKEHYLAAVASRNNPSEELLAKANLCFVYLDAEKYPDCVALADGALSQGLNGGDKLSQVCDLLRIALAAAKVSLGDEPGAAKALNETKDLAAFGYLFNTEDLKARVLTAFARLPGLKAEVAAFLTAVAKKLGLL